MNNRLKKLVVKKAVGALLPVLSSILPFIIIGFFALLFFIMLLGVFSNGDINNNDHDFDDGDGLLSDEVLAYRGLITEYAELHGVPDQVHLLMAIMMQESSGKGGDPMQSSNSYCGEVDCIDDPELSIDKGVEYFSTVWESADEKTKLALQSYNFGGGFIDYVMEHEGEYTLQLAIDFSAMMYEKYKHTGKYKCIRPEAIQYDACYGDIFYVDAVLQYYKEDGEFDGDFVWPLDVMEVTSPFGERIIDGKKDFHQGTDLRCKGGITKIKAMMDGKVRVGTGSSMGNYVSLLHNDQIITRYLHLSEPLVRNGEEVKAGDYIGVCGSTGRSTGPHLHLDVIIDEKNIDPQSYFGF